MAAGGSDGGADRVPPHQCGERLGLEVVHDHERGAGAQAEQRVVEPGVQRHRHRDQVRRRALARIGGAVAAQRSEHPVEELEVGRVPVEDRLGRSGRARRPHHEGHVLVVGLGPLHRGDPVDGDVGGRRRRVEHRGDLGCREPRVHRHVDAAGQPHPSHRCHQLGAVRQLHSDAAPLQRTEQLDQLLGCGAGESPGLSGRD